MRNIAQEIESSREDPKALEKLYRGLPIEFTQAFTSVYATYPDLILLQAWHERLNNRNKESVQKSSPSIKEWLLVGLLAILAGVITRLTLYWADLEKIAPINVIFGIVVAIAVYFVYQNRPKVQLRWTIMGSLLLSIVWMNVLPFEQTDSLILAYLHLPVFLWVVIGLAFAGDQYHLNESRLNFLKFNGEFVILYAVMAISGILLAMLTLQLFDFAGLDISEFYFENIVVIGAGFMAVIATYLIAINLKLAKNIAQIISRIFSPLILITLAVYLSTVAWLGKNPFLDRDFLILFNAILLVVLAVTIFTLTERSNEAKRNFSDIINLALMILALIIDGVALASILFRLSAYGITPNRIAVLGVNVLIGVHLVWIMIASLGFVRGKKSLSNLRSAVTRYLPVYGIWAAFVAIAFPLIFD